MKKLWAVLLLLLTLTGCASASGEMERAMALRAKILKAQSLSFETELNADYGDRLYTFSMGCTGDQNGDLTFAVTAPESIAGITGKIGPQGGKLTFDDTALQFDLMADDQISPVSAPWVLLKTLRSGCITAAGTEEGRLRLTIDDSYRDDALRLDIWLNEEDLPEKADILWAGRRILSLSVKNFVLS